MPAIIADLQDAFRWVHGEGAARFGADPARIGVVGGSAGGYLALMAGCCVQPRPRALVSCYGYGDIIGPWYSKPDPGYCRQPLVSREEAYASVGQPGISGTPGANERWRFYLYCRQHGLWPQEVLGADPAAAPERFGHFCPEQQVTGEYPPTLLLHGDQDTDVPHALSVSMAAALARAGVEHELIIIPGGGHGFDGAGEEAAMAARRRALDFLGEHVR